MTCPSGGSKGGGSGGEDITEKGTHFMPLGAGGDYDTKLTGKETDKAIEIKMPDGSKEWIPKSQVLGQKTIDIEGQKFKMLVLTDKGPKTLLKNNIMSKYDFDGYREAGLKVLD